MSSRNLRSLDDSRRHDVFHGLRGVRRRRRACCPGDEVAGAREITRWRYWQPRKPGIQELDSNG
jgi:hypothetical protein